MKEIILINSTEADVYFFTHIVCMQTSKLEFVSCVSEISISVVSIQKKVLLSGALAKLGTGLERKQT